VEVAELGDVHVGAVAVDFDLRQLRLDPAELPVGQVLAAAPRFSSMRREAIALAGRSTPGSVRAR
jgi:hypothetical protein